MLASSLATVPHPNMHYNPWPSRVIVKDYTPCEETGAPTYMEHMLNYIT
jgi:hypothetical protein